MLNVECWVHPVLREVEVDRLRAGIHVALPEPVTAFPGVAEGEAGLP
jgi:hypothetical protein